MIRIRLNRGIFGNELVEKFDFLEKGNHYVKNLGEYEIQIKPSFPSNVRLKDWDDNRAPWILFKFLLLLEAKKDVSGKLRIDDNGKYKILKVKDTLELISELSKYTDIKHRLDYWYEQFKKGKLKDII